MLCRVDSTQIHQLTSKVVDAIHPRRSHKPNNSTRCINPSTSFNKMAVMQQRNSGTTNGSGAVVAYRIDYESTKNGKTFSGTKRRVRWRFGFANEDALRRGLQGEDCRGEEHDVLFVSSLASGKKTVLSDRREIHRSKELPIFYRDDKFELTWPIAKDATTSRDREATVVSYANPPKNRQPIDLFIGGISFWDLPEIYQLGGGGGSSNCNGNMETIVAGIGPTNRSSPSRATSLPNIPLPQPHYSYQQQQLQQQQIPAVSPQQYRAGSYYSAPISSSQQHYLSFNVYPSQPPHASVSDYNHGYRYHSTGGSSYSNPQPVPAYPTDAPIIA